MIPIKSDEEIEKLRESARLLVKTFRAVEAAMSPGVRTETLDQVAEEVIKDNGGTPAFKGYRGYPSSICASIEEVVVHGIPGKMTLQEEQIISVDIGVEKEGFFSDATKTYPIGNISEARKSLIETTKQALHRGISQCREGNQLSDISHAVQSYAESKGYSVVRALVGHGIGRKLHEEPQIPNFGPPHQGPKILKGMVFAIEPMVNMGEHEVIFSDDGWTVKTKDSQPSAHFEHTILVTEGKPEILTLELESEP